MFPRNTFHFADGGGGGGGGGHPTGLISHEEEEEQEEFEDIPADSLWAYCLEQGELPIAFVYHDGTYMAGAPALSVFPSWAISPSAESIQVLRGLSFEGFWEFERQKRLVLVARPIQTILELGGKMV